MTQTADVLVIGGGILGCAAAYYLARRGLAIIVVDKGDLASEATGATTAGITLQNRPPDRFPFYQAAAACWPALGDELDDDLGYVRCGSLMVATGEEDAEHVQQRVRDLKALGLDADLLTVVEARSLAPWLGEGLPAVSFCPSDGYVDPQRPPRAFAAAAVRHGARILPHHPVQALRRGRDGVFRALTPQGEIQAGKVVNAAGAWAGRIAGTLDVSLPVSLDPLQAMATAPTPAWLDRVVLHISGKLTLKRNQSGRVVIGGGWQAEGDLDDGQQRLRPQERAANLALAYRAVPALQQLPIEREWVGLEGRSPDRYPFFGEVRSVPGFFLLACAHGGFTLSPLLGRQLADLMVDGCTTFPMEQFTCRQFLEAQVDDAADARVSIVGEP